MIILIAGSTHAGKTLFAQKLLEVYSYPYLSIDHLKMGLIRSGRTSLTPESDGRLLTDYLWPVVREMIKTAIENKQNLIVEGCYIPFDFKRISNRNICRRSVMSALFSAKTISAPISLTSGPMEAILKTAWRMNIWSWSHWLTRTGKTWSSAGHTAWNMF